MGAQWRIKDSEYPVSAAPGSEKPDNKSATEEKVLKDYWQTVPLCGTPLTAFQSCILKLNNTIIDGVEGNFHFNAYLENQLGLSQQEKDNIYSRTTFWYEDTPKNYDTVEMMAPVLQSSNSAFNTKWQYVANEGLLYTYSKIPLSLSKTKKLCVPGVSMELLLNHNPDTFRLLCKNRNEILPKLHFEKIFINVTRYHLSNELYIAINARLAAGALARYQVSFPSINLSKILFIFML